MSEGQKCYNSNTFGIIRKTTMFIFPLILYVASIIGGVWIAKTRNRWVAVPLCLFLSVLGLLFSFLLKKRCPSCAEYMYPSAKVCPHCGRNWKDGTVAISRVSKAIHCLFSLFVVQCVFTLSVNAECSLISELGYGPYRFGEQIGTNNISFHSTEHWVSTRYEPIYGSRDIKDEYGFALAMRGYRKDERGLFSIDLSPGATAGISPPECYDEALAKLLEFIAKVESDLGITIPSPTILVPKDEYDGKIAEKRAKEAEERTKGNHISCEWTVFVVPDFDYKGTLIGIRSTAWTDCPTTIHMNMRRYEKRKTDTKVSH